MLREITPAYEQAGVTLALETYEQVPVATLVGIIEHVDSPNVGICLDPGNCVAALEIPADTIARTAPHVRNLHVKDFTFTRKDGWVGFTFAGCPLGEGLLDYDAMNMPWRIPATHLAYLEPTLVEVVACMVGDLLNDALQETVHTVGFLSRPRVPCCSATSRWPWPMACGATSRSLTLA